MFLAGTISAAQDAMSVMPVRDRSWVVDHIQHEVICMQRAMSPSEGRLSSGDATCDVYHVHTKVL